MRTLEYTVPEADHGIRAGTLYRQRLGLSRHLLSRLKFCGGLLLDGEPVRTDTVCRAGQVLSVFLEDRRPAWTLLEGQEAPFGAVYEDDDILIADKPAPLPTLSGRDTDGRSLESGVWAYWGKPEHFVFRPVNRLDKGTSGLLAIARHAHAQAVLQGQLHTPALTREYLAVTEGIPGREEGSVCLPIGKPDRNSVRRAVLPDGREARTDYRVLRVSGSRALLRLKLYTGRTHQIRVHLQAIGCPVAGDYVYGTALDALPGRFALHSCALQLCHPVTGVRMCWESPLPEELEELLQ